MQKYSNRASKNNEPMRTETLAIGTGKPARWDRDLKHLDSINTNKQERCVHCNELVARVGAVRRDLWGGWLRL